MLKNFLVKTDNVVGKIASIAISLALIGVSTVVVTSAADSLFGNKLRAKFRKFKARRLAKKVQKGEYPENTKPLEQLDPETAKQCADYAEKDVSVVEEAKESFGNFNKELNNGNITFDDEKGTIKKSLKKKGSSKSLNLAEVDNPEDLPAPNTESQE